MIIDELLLKLYTKLAAAPRRACCRKGAQQIRKNIIHETYKKL